MIALGIDTSNYTTSAAIYDGNTHKSLRKILDVKEGMRGIRQSDGVFVHNRELPHILEELLQGIKIDTVGVSTKPRNAEGSYMPVFTVGHGYARAISASLNVDLNEFSHQDGHIMSGVYSSNAFCLLKEPFISVHLSGGTTEILISQYNGYNFNNEIIGGTLDISAGQLIDRVGVAMGIKFPCGKALEKTASATDETIKLPFSIKGSYVNLSGVETKLLNMIDGENPIIARTVLVYIKDVLSKTLQNAVKTTGIKKILLVGGVASNAIIRDGLKKVFADNIFFATPELSSDNAVGCAVLAHILKEKYYE